MFKNMIRVRFVHVWRVIADRKSQLRIIIFNPQKLRSAFFVGKAEQLRSQYAAF